jgi:hypothetical protein
MQILFNLGIIVSFDCTFRVPWYLESQRTGASRVTLHDSTLWGTLLDWG